MEGRSWWHLQRYGVLLANAARIAARGGLKDRAAFYLGRLEAEAERWSQPTVRALVSEARADLLPQGHSDGTQLRLLARQLWTSAKIDYHETRVRFDLARTYLAAGDRAGAEAELRAAERTATRVASPRLLSECKALRAQLSARSTKAA